MPENNRFHPIAIRIQALALVSWGIPVNEVSTALGIPARTLRAIEKRAKDRGYKPQENQRIDISFVEDAKRSGRPKEIDFSKESETLDSIRKDRAGREKSTEILAFESDDWKNVIWTDETSVVLGHRRGALRVWRTTLEAYDRTCIRRRWKKASTFESYIVYME
ncbi:hypothetical protein CIHG_01600 [Coccidioides immitis H538.4]|uniref:Uncharacterized protein n=3 Tax=Coccidioides immitis TaxID=5501 RepID=A0A0J8QSC9_COCIT|nr:hypothetical protein CIRG_01451 [Coccidioides immitis RMSCC 2394]KMU75401.1 hypothetical protein CISG_05036 [Coccidioides immitis RMSCC 3703]KMU83816.1 hypothetical protein CIHG_01600 [Coccidioides immitis H538.4]